ncbi:hypothetical protein [Thermohalobacter berrensis]|nr:hypothetical protein [Thermohalobacter berrensis]
MAKTRKYKIKRGNVFFKEEKKFKTIFHEVFWKVKMVLRGFDIEKL